MCVNRVCRIKILSYVLKSQRPRPSKICWTGQYADNVVKKGQETSKINIVNTMVNEYDKNRYRVFGNWIFVNIIFAISGIYLNFKNNEIQHDV